MKYEGIDLSFRPSARLFPMAAEKLVHSRVKGSRRREALATAVEEGRFNEVDPFFTKMSLGGDELRQRSAIHPQLMGGEYLPEFDHEEVEVARVELASVTADVISVRCRKDENGFHYRVVDEYDNECLAEPTEVVTDKPLCLFDLGKFVCRTACLSGIIALNEFEDADTANGFFRGRSEFYLEFGEFIRQTVEHLLRSEARED